MADPNRRQALQASLGAGVLATAGVANVIDGPSKRPTDRDHVLAAGMTDAEADCWELAAKLAGAFFDLPTLHPMDKAEVANAVHVIQNKLLSRPTYRKYLDLAKKAANRP